MRVTESDLDHIVELINKKTGHATSPYLKVDGVFQAQVGTYYIDSAYGYHKLQQICDINERVGNITRFVRKEELLILLYAFLVGVVTCQGTE